MEVPDFIWKDWKSLWEDIRILFYLISADIIESIIGESS
jgi:hypothetical protein